MSARRGPAQARKRREVITGQQIKAADLQLWKLLKKGSSILRAEVPEQLAQLVWRNIRAGASQAYRASSNRGETAHENCVARLGLTAPSPSGSVPRFRDASRSHPGLAGL